MPTKPGDRLPVTELGEYFDVVEVIDANDYLMRKRLEQPVSFNGSQGERCALYGSPTSRERQFRAGERQRLRKARG